jgi:hypothetical protein
MPTVPRNIFTPFGPKPERVWEKLQVLGVSAYMTQTGNLPDDRNLQWEEYVDISVPLGTLLIIPTTNYWVLGHGSISPEFINPLDDNASLTWHSDDHHWGMGWVQVVVDDVYEADYTAQPPEQLARLLVVLHLSDINADDSWFGIVGYTLTFLGQVPSGTGPRASEIASPNTGMRVLPDRKQRRGARIRAKKMA